jgi:18S rRNA (adenine1779-N6/adenine1780-N6)-dimethyltransferase
LHSVKSLLLEKTSGQYLITNEDLVDKIMSSLCLRASDTFLELGCASGSITTRVAPTVKAVYVNDSDDSLLNEAVSRVRATGYTNLETINGDALNARFPRFDICFSNLPFAMSSPILFKLIAHRPLWRSTVLILQREFTDALLAEAGERNYSRLSMNASIFVRTERLQRINGACFYPVPPVESALVRLTPRNPPPVFDLVEFNAMTKIAFIEKKRALKVVFSRPFVELTLERNYKNYCSFHRIPTSALPFPKYLQSALADSGLADYPVKHLNPEAMEYLLNFFHERGIFFSSLGSGKISSLPWEEDEMEIVPSSSQQDISTIPTVTDPEIEPIPVVS